MASSTINEITASSVAAALLYLVITVPLARLVDRMGGEGYVR